MIKITDCTRKTTCYDCDNEQCIYYGDLTADCPKWVCDNNLDCENCEFIDWFIEEERRRYGC